MLWGKKTFSDDSKEVISIVMEFNKRMELWMRTLFRSDKYPWIRPHLPLRSRQWRIKTYIFLDKHNSLLWHALGQHFHNPHFLTMHIFLPWLEVKLLHLSVTQELGPSHWLPKNVLACWVLWLLLEGLKFLLYVEQSKLACFLSKLLTGLWFTHFPDELSHV